MAVLRPATWELITVAITIGQMLGMHVKHIQSSTTCAAYPRIMLPILTPAHPSDRNNQALQSLMIDRWSCSTITTGPSGSSGRTKLGRTARSSDCISIAIVWTSIDLAGKVAPIIEQGALFAENLKEARDEWKVHHPSR